MSGAFTISLDTELAWGSFDHGGHRRQERAYRATPAVVERLCGLFERYDVPATWAFVAHLFEPCDGTHDGFGDGWYGGLPCTAGVDERLWYAPELLEAVRDCGVEQDVGLHGYTHLVFDEHDRRTADRELAAAVAVADRHGIDPVSFVYPRNRVAHVDLLADHGFEVYRGVDARWYETAVPPWGRRPLRFVDEALSVAPPTVQPRERAGVVCVPGSQVFRPDHGGWGFAPDRTQVTRARKGLDRAAATGDVFHLWWHPFNFGRDPDRLLPKLERILAYADELRADGRLELRSLRSVATAHGNGRWDARSPTTNRSAENGVTT